MLAHTSKTERLTKEVKSIGQNFIAKKTKKNVLHFVICMKRTYWNRTEKDSSIRTIVLAKVTLCSVIQMNRIHHSLHWAI